MVKKSGFFVLVLSWFLGCGMNINNKLLSQATGGATSSIERTLKFEGGDPNTFNRQGQTPLMLAARGGHLNTIKLLLENGAQTQRLDDEQWSALTYAAAHGRLEVVNLLLQWGADASGVNRYGNTPLHWAVENNHPLIVRRLLEVGADPDAVNMHGNTPRQLARRQAQLLTEFPPQDKTEAGDP